MKKSTVEKIEQEIYKKTNLPEEVKLKIRNEVFINIIIGITINIYFMLLIFGSIDTIKNIRTIDFNIFSLIILGISIYVFEIAYKKESGKLALFGIEILVVAIATLFLPYVIFELNNYYKRYYLMVSAYIGIYYIIKSIYITTKIKKEYIKQMSDIKDIIKKDRKQTNNTVDVEEETKEKEIAKKVNENKEQKKTTKSTSKKTTAVKKKTTVKATKTEDSKDTDKLQPKKRGRPKKTDTNKNNQTEKIEQNAPKKRGRPRKVVASND